MKRLAAFVVGNRSTPEVLAEYRNFWVGLPVTFFSSEHPTMEDRRRALEPMAAVAVIPPIAADKIAEQEISWNNEPAMLIVYELHGVRLVNVHHHRALQVHPDFQPPGFRFDVTIELLNAARRELPASASLRGHRLAVA